VHIKNGGSRLLQTTALAMHHHSANCSPIKLGTYKRTDNFISAHQQIVGW